MIFRDISTEKQSLYRLNANEKAIFFMLNRSGDITFDLAGENAEAHIFACFVGNGQDKQTLRITQHHTAPKTISSALIKSALSDESEFTYEGLIRIEQTAKRSDASQESRSLLLSKGAQAFSKPALEILADDVICRHAATVSPLDPEQLFFAESRGLTEKQAEQLLVDGFFNDISEKIHKLGIDTETHRLKLPA